MRWTRLRLIAAAALPLLLFGCVHTDALAPRTAPSPQTFFSPPSDAVPRAVETPVFQLPPGLASLKRPWTLTDLVDIGLSNNMQTRMAWSAARSAAAALGAARGAFFPRLVVDVNGAKTKGSAVGGRFVFDYSSLTPTAGLSWLLIDFGGRSGLTEEARDALAAANWTQNAVLQNVILLIEQDYYQYVAAKALLAAQETSRGEAEKNLEAAEARRRAGVATLADSLQAKTVLSRIQLDLVTTQGLIQTLKGVLANSLGLPADAAFEIAAADLPDSFPVSEAAGTVERRIAEALARRPDLAAARALALKAAAHVDTVRAQGLPTINFNGSIGRIYYSTPAQSSSLSAGLVLDIPLFRGWTVAYQALQAQIDAETAQAQVKKAELDVALQVWTSYFNIQTSAQRIKTAQDLLNLAQQSYDVVLGSYKEGVSSILDLLAAQSALENGRVQLVQAQAQWLLALVQFARDSGTLGAPGAASAPTEKGDR
jgi:outer membrane protein TolC